MITTTALTSHDLAKMFPTPPSIEEPVIHQTMSPTNADNHNMTSVHSTMLLSPADSGRGNASEEFGNLRSPATVGFYITLLNSRVLVFFYFMQKVHFNTIQATKIETIGKERHALFQELMLFKL